MRSAAERGGRKELFRATPTQKKRLACAGSLGSQLCSITGGAGVGPNGCWGGQQLMVHHQLWEHHQELFLHVFLGCLGSTGAVTGH